MFSYCKMDVHLLLTSFTEIIRARLVKNLESVISVALLLDVMKTECAECASDSFVFGE